MTGGVHTQFVEEDCNKGIATGKGNNTDVFRLACDSESGGWEVQKWEDKEWKEFGDMGATVLEVDSNGAPWIVNEDGEVKKWLVDEDWKDMNLPEVDGEETKATALAAGPNGEVYALGEAVNGAKPVYKNEAGSWKALGDKAKGVSKLSINNAGLALVINASGQLSCLDFDTEDGVPVLELVKEEEPAGMGTGALVGIIVAVVVVVLIIVVALVMMMKKKKGGEVISVETPKQ